MRGGAPSGRVGAIGLRALLVLLASCNVSAVLGSGGSSTGDGGLPSPDADVGVGAIGTWIDVTPPGVNLRADFVPDGNYGVMDVVVDPARPSDLYAFICYQGVWRSTDYGLTWTKVSVGTKGNELDAGRPWSAAIDPNPARDPETPPTLYTGLGYGPETGVFRSVDGGVDWTHMALPSPSSNACSIEIDPYDSTHLVAGLHAEGGLVESLDMGQTWSTLTMPTGTGVTLYAFFVDRGDAATTRGTWLTQPEWGAEVGASGAWKTTTAGASWTRVESLEHAAGEARLFQSGPSLYMASAYGSAGRGIYRSVDAGSTWVRVFESDSNVVFGSSRYVYGAAGGATTGAIAPSMVRAPLGDPTAWSPVPTPPTMTNGPKRVALTHRDGHDILVGGNHLAGIWRYVE